MLYSRKTHNKDKLFKLMESVGGLNKQPNNQIINEKNKIVKDFVEYTLDYIGGVNEKPSVDVQFECEINENPASEMKSFACYYPDKKHIYIVGCNRNLADVLRSLAHELVHHKQNIDGVLHEDSGKSGSEHENQANALAGEIMRNYGKQNPKIYE